MTPAELAQRMDEVQLVDVRYRNEWEAGHIEAATHIPADELDDRLDEVDKERPVVTVCRTGQRSASAAEQLAADGFEAENLEGGMVAWSEGGRAVVRDDGEPGSVVEPEPPSDDRPQHLQRLEREFLSVLADIDAHFGGREASDVMQRFGSAGRRSAVADARH
jgi:rhodanese-related sulfurtransferase